jgi:hypothetical protein
MLLVLNAYNEARSLGLKHSAAVSEAVAVVKNRLPDVQISQTEVKRILAEYQPSGALTVLTTKKNDVATRPLPPEVCRQMGIPEGSRMRSILAFGFGPKPQYPRVNSRASENYPSAEKEPSV